MALNMASSAAPNVTERKSVVRTSTKDASGPNLSGGPYQAERVSSAGVFPRAMGTGAGAAGTGTGTGMALLSPGRSSMRVAGAKKESFYEYPGDMLYFDAVDLPG